MKRLLWSVAAIIAGLSLFPFTFQTDLLTPEALRAVWARASLKTSLGDVLGNVLLFIPFGGLCVYVWPHHGFRWWRAFFLSVLIGGLFAALLQLAQIALPSRDASLADVFWNMVGTIIGAAGALVFGRIHLSALTAPRPLALVPCLLVLAWLSYRLIPFLPSFDLQSIKDSVKPLLIHPDVTALHIFHAAVMWLVAAFLLRQVDPAARYDRHLPVFILATFAAEVLIVYDAIHASGVLGAVLAVAVWQGASSLNHRVRSGFLALLLAAAIVLAGLDPFIFRQAPAPFTWVPFLSILSGSILVNIVALSEKIFLYGSVFYLLRVTALPYWMSLLLACTLIGAVEVAQVFYWAHTPEITDLLLVILIASALEALRDHKVGL